MNKNINIPLSEYPRPQLVRDSYLSLNGYWSYRIFDKKNKLRKQGKILVPFSPECKLSGVESQLMPKETLIYNLEVDISDFIKYDHILLHFDKVDQLSELYINNNHVLDHTNGYLPFECDVKPYLKKDSSIISIELRVKDDSNISGRAKGKQRLSRGGIFYTAQSGIYMPVWIEGVNKNYIQKLKIKPDIDRKILNLTVFSIAKTVNVTIENVTKEISTNKEVSIAINDLKLWSPESPYLYDLKISSDDDIITSYFAMRKFSLIKDSNNIMRLALNNKPYFFKGVLDQGYWEESLLTPPNDEAYIKDIMAIKDMGFNVTRKHIKVENLRFYYHCDRLGLVVWQDFINGGGDSSISKHFIFSKLVPHLSDDQYWFFHRRNKKIRIESENEFYELINYLFNVPSIGLWTIFNEGWGQFDSERIYKECLKIDNTRIYDHASGWYDQNISDVKSLHVYFKRVKMPKIEPNRAIILSECGGYSLRIPNHYYSKKEFGYKKMHNSDELLKYYSDLVDIDVINNIPKGLSAFIYTELSDVEDELNGFLTYDRKVNKIPFEKIKEINDKIKY